MTEWYDNQVMIDGAVATIHYDDLDRVLSFEWRLASWIGSLCRVAEIPGGGTYIQQISASEDDPAFFVEFGEGNNLHDHCASNFCHASIEWNIDHESQLGYYAQEDDDWLCPKCGEAVLKWRETDECREYMERRRAGLPGPPDPTP